jgi:hypothetical protein
MYKFVTPAQAGVQAMYKFVTPAQAGVQAMYKYWIPAFAGMTIAYCRRDRHLSLPPCCQARRCNPK